MDVAEERVDRGRAVATGAADALWLGGAGDALSSSSLGGAGEVLSPSSLGSSGEASAPASDAAAAKPARAPLAGDLPAFERRDHDDAAWRASVEFYASRGWGAPAETSAYTRAPPARASSPEAPGHRTSPRQ